jgi:hypothetical protein
MLNTSMLFIQNEPLLISGSPPATRGSRYQMSLSLQADRYWVTTQYHQLKPDLQEKW